VLCPHSSAARRLAALADWLVPAAGGELLDAVLDQGHYSEADARTIFRQLIEAIQYLHSR
jgi:hypothetical protein